MKNKLTSQERFLRAFVNGETLTSVSGVYGRILRTKQPNPKKLTDEHGRRCAMVIGPKGLLRLLGKSHKEALLHLGYSPAYIDKKLEDGFKFKLVVFQRPSVLYRGTWRGVITCVAHHYPEFAGALWQALPTLRRTSLDAFQKQAGFDFVSVHEAGIRDPRFMTVERFLSAEKDACAVRRFLFHQLNINELFGGRGVTLTHEGELGVIEYITENVMLSTLGGLHMTDLNDIR